MVAHLSSVPVFVAAAEAGSFSAAADRLNLTRSAVGKAVARLEEQVGARLFHRTTRRQTLTTEGLLYFEHCRRALDELRAGEEALESGKQAVAGRLRVTMPVLFGRICVAPLLTGLAVEHADLELHLSFTDRHEDLLNDGYDLGLRTGRLIRSDGLMVRRVGEQRMILCAAPSYLTTHGAPGGLEEIPAHAAIAYSRGGRPRPWIFGGPGKDQTSVQPRARLLLDDLEAIADAGVAGLGLVWLPSWLVHRHLESGSLVELLSDRAGFAFPFHLVWPETTHLPHRVRVAIDLLAVRLPEVLR